MDFVDKNSPTADEIARACGLDPAKVATMAAEQATEMKLLAGLGDQANKIRESLGLSAKRFRELYPALDALGLGTQ